MHAGLIEHEHSRGNSDWAWNRRAGDHARRSDWGKANMNEEENTLQGRMKALGDAVYNVIETTGVIGWLDWLVNKLKGWIER